MRKLAILRSYHAVLSAQELLSAHARQTNAECLAREAKAELELRKQEAVLEEAIQDWSSYLTAAIAEPQQLQRLGATIAQHDMKRTDLVLDAETAKSNANTSRLAAGTAAAHVQLTRHVLKGLRNSLRDQRDEATAQVTEDRTTYAWTQT